jgi:quinol monooxygenase YgiN
MLIVHVYIHVKPEAVEAFKEITLANARGSVQEPGVIRFDIIQQADDPTRFVLMEIYRDADAPAKHKETAHYHAWLAAATDMMAEPRTRQSFSAVFPEAARWEMPGV